MNLLLPNQPTAPNPAGASRFHFGLHWRGVGEPDRSRRVVRREETEKFEDRKKGRPSAEIIFLSLIFLSIADLRGRPGRLQCLSARSQWGLIIRQLNFAANWKQAFRMARPLRIELAGGWYHVTNRGNERKAIYRDERDRGHFLELVEETTLRLVSASTAMC